MTKKMKRLSTVSILLVLLSLSVSSFGVRECLDSYFAGLDKCFQIFDSQKRFSCYWGEAETLKAGLEAVSGDKQSLLYGARIIAVDFFRNEKTEVSSCEPFSVPASGKYWVTAVAGSPLDKRSMPKTFSLSLFDGKASLPVIKFGESNQEASREVKLEQGRNYVVTVDELMPVASFVTVIISDKPIDVR